MTRQADGPVTELLHRSHVLGGNPRYTNYGGGNTSSKSTVTDPVTREEVPVVWIKGSGSDLATLSRDGLSQLRLDRLHALGRIYRGHEHEDEMVPLLSLCGLGPVGATPSIDTAMHSLVGAAHVDHLHSDAPLALATAADGRRLTKEAFGDRVLWVDWLRPGWQLGLDMAGLHERHPEAIGCILGGHGFTAWGGSSDECMAHSLEIIHGAQEFIRTHGRPDPLGPVHSGWAPLPQWQRSERAAALLPILRGLASSETRVVGHYTDTPEVLEFTASEKLPHLASLGTSCPDHFTRTKIRPLVLDLPPSAPLPEVAGRLRVLFGQYRRAYAAYYARHAAPDSPPLGHCDPTVVLVPGVGMFSFGKDKHTARIVGEFFVSDINAMRGAEALTAYAPIPESEQFRIEYWSLERDKLARLPQPKPLAGQVAIVCGSPVGLAIAGRLVRDGACVLLAGEDHEALARAAAGLSGGEQVAAAAIAGPGGDPFGQVLRQAVLQFGGADMVVFTGDAGGAIRRWAAQAAAVMAAQGLGGDIICVFSPSRTPAPVSTATAPSAEAQQVAALARELAADRVRVNGIRHFGNAPQQAAAAVAALTASGLTETSGALIPVGDLAALTGEPRR